MIFQSWSTTHGGTAMPETVYLPPTEHRCPDCGTRLVRVAAVGDRPLWCPDTLGSESNDYYDGCKTRWSDPPQEDSDD